jgi:hypothetical protein
MNVFVPFLTDPLTLELVAFHTLQTAVYVLAFRVEEEMYLLEGSN